MKVKTWIDKGETRMPKNLIIIEDGKQFEFETEQDLVKKLIAENYYNLGENEKKEKLKICAIANSINKKVEIVEEISDKNNLENKIICSNERAFILSLIINSNLILLENVNSNVFINGLDKTNFTKNYIIVNKFAKKLLKEQI